MTNQYSSSYVVYVIGCKGYYKIGHTHNLQERLKQLQIGCPFKLKLYWKDKFRKSEDCVNYERQLHKKYALKRIQGEWFKLTKKDLNWLYALNQREKISLKDHDSLCIFIQLFQNYVTKILNLTRLPKKLLFRS